MRKILLATCLITSCSLARPFIGGAGYFSSIRSFPCPVYSGDALASTDGCSSMNGHNSFGGEVQGGIYTRVSMLYGGLSVGRGYLREEYSYGNARERHWTEYHLLLGARIHAADNIPNPVKPTAGIGITLSAYGESQEAHGEYEEIYGRDEVNYKPGFGYFFEAGFLVRPSEQAILSFIGRGLFAEIEDKDGDTIGAIEGLVMIGFAYLFK